MINIEKTLVKRRHDTGDYLLTLGYISPLGELEGVNEVGRQVPWIDNIVSPSKRTQVYASDDIAKKAKEIAKGGYISGDFGSKAMAVQTRLLANAHKLKDLWSKINDLKAQRTQVDMSVAADSSQCWRDYYAHKNNGDCNKMSAANQAAYTNANNQIVDLLTQYHDIEKQVLIDRAEVERARCCSALKVYALQEDDLAAIYTRNGKASQAKDHADLAKKAHSAFDEYSQRDLAKTPQMIAAFAKAEAGGSSDQFTGMEGVMDWIHDIGSWIDRHRKQIQHIMQILGPVLQAIGAGLCATGYGCAIGVILIAAGTYITSAAAGMYVANNVIDQVEAAVSSPSKPAATSYSQALTTIAPPAPPAPELKPLPTGFDWPRAIKIGGISLAGVAVLYIAIKLAWS